MFINKKIRYWGTALILMGMLNVILLNSLQGSHSYLQQKMESSLPRKDEQVIELGKVRVLIKTNGFSQIVHAEVKVSSESGLEIISEGAASVCSADEIVTITPEDERFKKGTIKITGAGKITISSLKRGCGEPTYRGMLELYKTAEGIVIVNELPLEQYLYAVVPSEMPASYEMEALKAQAVCARSYAYNQTRDYSYPEYKAHVDDSTAFQVYGNSKEQKSTNHAVLETAGELLWYNNRVATAYYYSTSCGKSASIEAWGSEFNENNQYLKSVELCDEDGNIYERELPWYRWTAKVSKNMLENLLELNVGKEIGNLQSLAVTKQGDGGIAQQITAIGSNGEIVVETENKIRRALGGEGYKIERQDGSEIDSSALLPSAFFTITKSGDNYIFDGGGYGHGIGMSQNGANEMAKSGKNYREILTTFYSNVEIK